MNKKLQWKQTKNADRGWNYSLSQAAVYRQGSRLNYWIILCLKCPLPATLWHMHADCHCLTDVSITHWSSVPTTSQTLQVNLAVAIQVVKFREHFTQNYILLWPGDFCVSTNCVLTNLCRWKLGVPVIIEHLVNVVVPSKDNK